jgi:hypothetical protein
MAASKFDRRLSSVNIRIFVPGSIVIHVWTAPVEQEDSDDGNTEAVRFIHVFGLFLCGLRPLAMMVSVDRALNKLPRCDAR